MTLVSGPSNSLTVIALGNYSINSYSRRRSSVRSGIFTCVRATDAIRCWRFGQPSIPQERSASSRLSHSPMRFRLVNVRVTNSDVSSRQSF